MVMTINGWSHLQCVHACFRSCFTCLYRTCVDFVAQYKRASHASLSRARTSCCNCIYPCTWKKSPHNVEPSRVSALSQAPPSVPPTAPNKDGQEMAPHAEAGQMIEGATTSSPTGAAAAPTGVAGITEGASVTATTEAGVAAPSKTANEAPGALNHKQHRVSISEPAEQEVRVLVAVRVRNSVSLWMHCVGGVSAPCSAECVLMLVCIS